MTERDPSGDKPLQVPFSNPAADLGWDRPLPPKWKAYSRSREPNASAAWRIFVPLAIACLAANFAVLPLMYIFQQRDWGAVWVYISGGLIGAQAAALSFAVVFLPGRWHIRMGIFWLTAAVLFAVWGAGFLTYLGMRRTQYIVEMNREILFSICSLPLLAILIQMPLWGLKLFAGWALVRPTEDGRKPLERPLSISDYLVGMAVIAASLAIARLAPYSTQQEFWAGWSIVAAVVATLSLISIPPAMHFVLRWPGGLAGLGATMVYAALAGFVALGIFWAIEASVRVRLGGPNAWELFGGFLILQSFALGLAVALLGVRALGYQLLVSKHAEPMPNSQPVLH